MNSLDPSRNWDGMQIEKEEEIELQSFLNSKSKKVNFNYQHKSTSQLKESEQSSKFLVTRNNLKYLVYENQSQPTSNEMFYSIQRIGRAFFGIMLANFVFQVREAQFSLFFKENMSSNWKFATYPYVATVLLAMLAVFSGLILKGRKIAILIYLLGLIVVFTVFEIIIA